MDPKIIKQLEGLLQKALVNVATKDDLKDFATKDDLKNFPTKDDLNTALANHPTKDDLDTALANHPTKDDLDTALANHPTKNDLKRALAKYATKDDLEKLKHDLIEEIKESEGFIVASVEKNKADKADVDDLQRRVTKLERRIAE